MSGSRTSSTDAYDAETDGSESAQAERACFDDEDGDDEPGGGDGDMQQQVGESSEKFKQKGRAFRGGRLVRAWR